MDINKMPIETKMQLAMNELDTLHVEVKDAEKAATIRNILNSVLQELYEKKNPEAKVEKDKQGIR